MRCNHHHAGVTSGPIPRNGINTIHTRGIDQHYWKRANETLPHAPVRRDLLARSDVPYLILSSTEVEGIHASTLLLFAWVGIPLLRFHPHPSQRRSIGQTIGLTAYPLQRAAIFTMLLFTRTFPAYSRLGPLFEASDISTTSEPTLPFGVVSFGPSRSGVCQTFKRPGARLLHDQKSGACARPVMVM